MASLPSFQTLCIIIYLQISTIQSLIKSTKIKPSLLPSLPASDITVTSGPGASVIADLWSIINVQSQGSDLQIQLGSSWGFNPSYISTIELYIEGNTSNETYNDDGEVLFVFSVSDQYFAELVSLDYRKTAYKECPDKGTPLITRDVTEMINGEKPDRYFRYCKNNISQINNGTDYWINAGSTSYKEPVEWPMFIQIINDPINHTVTYNWGDVANNFAIKVFSYYTSSYPTNQGLNIHIATESPNEDFYIFSIDVTYHYTSTPAPTSNPTIAPTTMNPTAVPTSNPTIPPTTPTTSNPTIPPTTANPTLPPTTANPTTSIPTINPMGALPLWPTADPTTETSWTSTSPSTTSKCDANDIGFINTTYSITTGDVCIDNILIFITKLIQVIDAVYADKNLVITSNITNSERHKLQFIEDTRFCGNISVHIFSCFDDTTVINKLINITKSEDFLDDISDETGNNTIIYITNTTIKYVAVKNNESNTLYIITISAASVLLLFICIICIFVYYKRKQQKDREAQEMVVQNAMVILISIGEYDDNPQHRAQELEYSHLRDLDGVEKDIENMCHVFGENILNFQIFPNYPNPSIPKLHWTQKEVLTLLECKAKELEENKEAYDGLFVGISAHGLSGYICCSDYTLISKIAIYRIFTTNYGSPRNIPRIFMYDVCEGSEERDGYLGRRSTVQPSDDDDQKTNMLTYDTYNDDDAADDDNNNLNTDNKEEFAKNFEETDIPRHYDTIWGTNTRSVDFKLAQVHAANHGFQAKLRSDLGSYMLCGFAENMCADLKKHNGKNYKYIYELIDAVQSDLESRGKQHIQATYNDETRFIRFKKMNMVQQKASIDNQQRNIESKQESMKGRNNVNIELSAIPKIKVAQE